jgi:HD superfamily phosphohydrolase
MEGLDDFHCSNSSFISITIAFSDMQLANEFLDTEEIQRLRDLKHLG